MDIHEIIALSIVVLAAVLALRHYRKSKGSCCGTGCSMAFKKKEEGNKCEPEKDFSATRSTLKKKEDQ